MGTQAEGTVGPRWPPAVPGTWVVDLDGVVWLSGVAIDGSADAVARLRDAGYRVLFATNNSSPTLAEMCRRLERIGIDADPDDVVTAAQAAASLVPLHSVALVVGDEGLREALAQRGVTMVSAEDGFESDGVPIDAVVVGWTRTLDFDRLAAAATAVRRGATLIGTNEDPTHPTPDGLLPGSGALLAAVATAAETEPVVAGKPHGAMADLIIARASDACVVVGDRPATDGLLARRLGIAYALVLSGVTGAGGDGRGDGLWDGRGDGRPGTTDGHGVAAGADAVAADLATLVDGVV
jgi:HAD superfamily hydrolase (TIGR01450 family)